MALNASDWASLRQEIQAMLKKNVPRDLTSDDPEYQRMTGLTTERLKADWKIGKITTGCNSFLGWVARTIGVPASSVLALGHLDISKADDEVLGSWYIANTGEAYEYNLHPRAGDFYSKPYGAQKFGHVGIVYDFDETAQTWTLIEGGQGGPKSGVDKIAVASCAPTLLSRSR